MAARYTSWRAFYPHYLLEHQHPTSRALHVVGTLGFLVCLALAPLLGNGWWLLAGPVWAYGLAWVGHYGFERNRPATFQYPLWSLASDFVMVWHLATGQFHRRLAAARANPPSPGAQAPQS